MIDCFGEDWLEMGKMSLKFIHIVPPGDILLPKAVVRSKIEKDSGLEMILDVWCENQRGEKVVIGTAKGLLKP